MFCIIVFFVLFNVFLSFRSRWVIISSSVVINIAFQTFYSSKIFHSSKILQNSFLISMGIGILFSILFLCFIIRYFRRFFGVTVNHHKKIARFHRTDVLLSVVSRRSALWSIDIFVYLIRDRSCILNVVFGNSTSVVLERF